MLRGLQSPRALFATCPAPPAGSPQGPAPPRPRSLAASRIAAAYFVPLVHGILKETPASTSLTPCPAPLYRCPSRVIAGSGIQARCASSSFAFSASSRSSALRIFGPVCQHQRRAAARPAGSPVPLRSSSSSPTGAKASRPISTFNCVCSAITSCPGPLRIRASFPASVSAASTSAAPWLPASYRTRLTLRDLLEQRQILPVQFHLRPGIRKPEIGGRVSEPRHPVPAGAHLHTPSAPPPPPRAPATDFSRETGITCETDRVWSANPFRGIATNRASRDIALTCKSSHAPS